MKYNGVIYIMIMTVYKLFTNDFTLQKFRSDNAKMKYYFHYQ